MSTSIAAQSIAARKPKKISRKISRKTYRRSSRKIISYNLFGAAAIGCLVVGASWTVYTKIFAASAYPTLGSEGYDEPVIRRAPRLALREAGEAVREVFAALPERVQVIAKPQAATSITPEMFNDRFAAASREGVASNAASAAAPAAASKIAEAKDAAKLADAAKVADAARAKRGAAAPTQIALNEPPQSARAPEAKSGLSVRDMAERAKAAVMSIASHERQSMVEKLWGKREPSGGLLAYASADASVTASIAPKEQNPMLGGSPPYDRSTAVYDITAKMVYLPDGTKLEAHSGLGSNLDNPRSSHIRMRGVTPPHIYELKPREALFHGVPALRLTPIGGESAIYGRDGLLAHTFMLGPNGDSNGCVSFRDYYAFLDAYKNKGIRKLAVLAKVE
jgi:hypothetical protein